MSNVTNNLESVKRFIKGNNVHVVMDDVDFFAKIESKDQDIVRVERLDNGGVTEVPTQHCYKTSKQEVEDWIAEHAEDMDEDDESKMSKILAKYRKNYKVTVSASGRKSLSKGDELAQLLEAMDVSQVMALAEEALGMEPGTLVEKYQTLNPGQKRMNSGNRLRAALKRGDVTIDDLKKLAGKGEA